MNLIQVDVIGLFDSPTNGGACALVLGEVGGKRRLPIIIGMFEGQAIDLEMKQIQPPRPLTHDLLRDAFAKMGGEILDVVIHALQDGTFFAKIRFMHEGEEKALDARPSDAVALAVRVEAAIFVESSVLDDAGIPTEDNGNATGESGEPGQELTKVERMELMLSEAIQAEDYEEAARLRDALLELKGQTH